MANKKVQAEIQVDVSFVGNTTKLFKDLEKSTSKLDLSSAFSKDFGIKLQKTFKDTFSTINKMQESLGKKGISKTEYTNTIVQLNTKLRESLNVIKNMKTEYTNMFKSEENKQATKQLKEYIAQLEKVKKIATENKKNETRMGTYSSKLKEEFGIDTNISKKYLSNIYNRTKNKEKLTSSQQAWIDRNNLDPEKLKKVLDYYEKILKAKARINANDEAANNVTGKGGVNSSEAFLDKEIDKLQKGMITQEQFKANLKIINNEIESSTQAAEQNLEEFGQVSENEYGRATENAKEFVEANATIKEILGQFGIVFSVGRVVSGFRDLIKSSYEFYKSLDSALNQIYVVSNLSSKAVDGLKGQFINMAKETGMAIDDITKSAVLFYQQGLNTQEVMEMTKVTSQFAKVAGIDATDAADKLTAAVNGYCLAATDASNVADKFNKVAAASAADINELSTAFSKAAAQANQAGVSMDNYLSYIATMEEATREAPENIGTSLKTIFSRMQQIKTGENTEDDVDVNQAETALRSVGIALRDTNGQLRDLEEIFDELGPKWNSLDRNTQAYLGTIIAGTRQQSRFITLMQNWDRVLDLSEQSANSAGQQALMHAKAMESIESKMEQLNVAWQEFISNLSDSSVIKMAITSLTKLLGIFNGANKPIALVAIAIAALQKSFSKLQKPINEKISGFMRNFKDKDGNVSIGNLKKNMKENADALKSVNKQIEESSQRILELERQKTEQKEKQKIKTDEQIAKERAHLAELQKQSEELKKQLNTRQMVGKALVAIGTSMNAIGIAIGQDDENLGGMVSTLGTAATLAGQIASGDWVAAIATGVTLIIQAYELIKKWDENIKKRVDDSVASIGKAMTEYSNQATENKSVESLIKSYNKLQSTMNRTAEEQQKLNDTIQQMADTYDLEVITDAYGNLSINIAEVTKRLEEAKLKQQELAVEMDNSERENRHKAVSGLGNNTSIGTFVNKNFASNRSNYYKLLGGIEDGLTDETRKISNNLAKTFSENLKTSILNTVQSDYGKYIGPGLAQTIMGAEKEINNALNQNDWNALYEEIDFLNNNVNDMTFDQVQESLDNFYNSWSGSNKILEGQWQAMVDSINNTVFKNSSLLEFYRQVDDQNNKASGKYYNENIDRLNQQISQKQEELNSIWRDGLAETGAIAGGSAAVGSAFGLPIAIASGLLGAGVGLVSTAISASSTQDELNDLKKTRKELEKQKQEYLQSIVDSNVQIHNTDQAQQWLDAQTQVADTLKGLTADTQAYLSSIEGLTNFENMSAKGAEQYAGILEGLSKSIDGVDNNADRYNIIAQYYEQNKGSMSAEVQAKMQEIMENAFNSLEIATPKSLKSIGESLKDIGGDLVTMNKIMDEFNENGAISLDTFIELADIIDKIDLESLSQLDPGAIEQYTNAIDNLNLAYSDSNGMITANGEALQSLQDLQELQTKSKIAGMIADLKASKATTETQIAFIDAQIAATDAAISAAQLDSENSVTGAQIKQAANTTFENEFEKSMSKISGDYENDVASQGKWSTAILSNLGTVADAWSKYFKGISSGSTTDLDNIKKQAKNIIKEQKIQWSGTDSTSGIQIDDNEVITKGSSRQREILSQLSGYRGKLENTKAKYQATLNLTNSEISMLESMMGSADLSKLGTSGSKGGGSKDTIEQYIGKLKEIYNILNRIDVLEHRLSTLDAYSEVARGENYGNLLKERLSYNEELLDQYEFLTTEQKQFTNGYKEFIQSQEGLEGVFDFDKFGQIIINWDKYSQLQDTAAKGEVTLKQKADDLYDTYTGMFEDLQGYFDNTIKYYKAVIELEQQMIDNYVEMEDKAANAIKEIYQKILNTKLEAIDKEKEALEDLQKAREQANKDKENAKAVSGLQTNLQRALMDTSGASASGAIKAQQDLNEKLDAIAEDKYSKMLDDLKQSLDDQKTAMQEEFDELFENLEWLFDWIDEDIIQNEERLIELFQQTDEWGQKSELQRKQLLEEWNTKYETYMAGLKDGKTIMDVWKHIGDTKDRIALLDENLKTELAKGSSEIATTLANWQKGIENKVNSISNSTGSGGGGGTTNKTTTEKTPAVAEKAKPGSASALISSIKILQGPNIAKPIYDNYSGKYFATLPDVLDYWGFTEEAKKLRNQSSFGNISLAKFASGGMAGFTGPAWLDGTAQHPEAVLNPLQTEHFIKFTNALDKMAAYGNIGSGLNSSVYIDNISFKVDSMSSAEDGERAFNMFVDKFKEIGNRAGLRIESYKREV